MLENTGKRKRLEQELTNLGVESTDVDLMASMLAVTVPSIKSKTLSDGVEMLNLVKADVVNIEQDASNLSECPYCKVVAAIKVRKTVRSADEQDFTYVSCKNCGRSGYIKKTVD